LQFLDQFVLDGLLFLRCLDQSEQSFSLSFGFLRFQLSFRQLLLHFVNIATLFLLQFLHQHFQL